MNRFHRLFSRAVRAGFALAVMGVGFGAGAAIQEEAVTYKDGDTVMKGFIVYDDASAANPSREPVDYLARLDPQPWRVVAAELVVERSDGEPFHERSFRSIRRRFASVRRVLSLPPAPLTS